MPMEKRSSSTFTVHLDSVLGHTLGAIIHVKVNSNATPKMMKNLEPRFIMSLSYIEQSIYDDTKS